MKQTIFILIAISISIQIHGQNKKLFVPVELQESYHNNTRSWDGKPGSEYFQNRANYQIKADFDPETGYLKGIENIEYFNNSKDTLNALVIRLYMNFFQKGVNRDFAIGQTDLHDGVQINNISVDGKNLDAPDGPQLMSGMGTNIYIRLAEPIFPSSSRQITIDWEEQLPTHLTVRFGQYGKGNWFVGYWYPQIAVYDDIVGWDRNAFTGSAEYYYDFNNYDVEITTPNDYMLWATGTLQTPEKHYQKGIMDRLNTAKESDDVIRIVYPEDIKNKKVLTKANQHVWHFKANDVPDFAFATSKSYVWDATSALVDKEADRRVAVHAVYKENTVNFDEVARISKKSLELFSTDIIGVPFPYEKLIAFNGSGGMEFPMMINDGDDKSFLGTVHVTAHEIGHNYFPFYVGTNEAYYAFMDEGLISFLPREVEYALIEDANPFEELMTQFSYLAGTMSELPLMTKSYIISDYPAYRTHAYTRPAVAFYFLRELVGKENFDKAFREYIHRWSKKHPTPYDFFYTFENVLDRDLSWYWKPWFFDFGYPDLALKEVTNDQISVVNKGFLPVPVKLEVHYTDGIIEQIDRNLDVWRDKQAIEISLGGDKQVKKVVLGDRLIPDSFPGDNVYE